MNGQAERKIEVKPSTVSNLAADVANERYRIPQFQREYVWNKAEVRELLGSVYEAALPSRSIHHWYSGIDGFGLN